MDINELHVKLKQPLVSRWKKPTGKNLELPATPGNSTAFDQQQDESTADGDSAIEALRKALKCSEEQMIDILTRNPRLRTIKYNTTVFEKIEVLFQYGARPRDLWMNTNVLKNQTLDTIKVRARKLHELGHNDPLPIGHIDRNNRIYKEIIRKLEENASSNEELRNSIKVLKQIPYVKLNTLHIHKGKLDYLASQGYSTQEILDTPKIFSDSLDTIRNSVEAMNSHYLEKVPLDRCLRHSFGKPNPPSGQRHVYKTLKTLNDHLTTQIRKKFVIYAKGIPTRMFRKFFPVNMSFLKDKGFSIDELSRLPIVLCHEPRVLEEWWERLWSDEKFRKEFEEDKVLALNMLQYSIEKQNNFRHFIPSAEVSEPTEASALEVDMGEDDIENDSFDCDHVCTTSSH